MRKSGGTARVARYLRQQIRASRPGVSLLAFRDMSKLCRVSATTLTTVVRQFEEMGLLHVRPKQGIFTVELNPSQIAEITPHELDVLYVGADPKVVTHNAFRQDMLHHLRQQPTERGLKVRFHGIDAGGEGVEQIQEIAEDEACQACVLVNLSSLAHLHPLSLNFIPYVTIYPESADLPTHNSIVIDNDQIIAEQVNPLLELGHRRIGYLHNVREQKFRRGEFFQRVAFYRTVLEHQLPVDNRDIAFAGHTSKHSAEGAGRVLDRRDPPTAVICKDQHLPMLYATAARLGLRIPEDLSVIGMNDVPDAVAVQPHATTVRLPRGQAVELSLKMLDRVLASPDAHVANQSVAIRLTVRDSIAPPRAAAAGRGRKQTA